jgi:hypothetical protein
MATKPTHLYQLKITLVDSKPPIWRRIIVRPNISLPRFHLVLQATMGWQDGHLHLFRVGQDMYGEPDDEMDFMKSEIRVRLDKLLRTEKDSLNYEYDFGDGWEHKVLLEKVLPFDPAIKTPYCVKGKLACPPEDCGGLGGYYGLLEVLADPKHPDYESMLEWLGGGFDPHAFSLAAVNELLGELAD